MKKRLLAGLLWFYVTWYAWGVLAWFAGVSEMPGLVLGLVAALLFAGDPLRRIWNKRPRVQPGLAAPTAAIDLA